MTPDLPFDGAQLRLVHYRYGNARLMVTFDHRSPGKQDFGPITPSQGFARNGFDQLMIKTQRNDWFINAETPAMEARLPDLVQGYDDVRALGFSMGGYGALRFARALGLGHLIAVSPQISIHPDVVPFDRRYRDEAQGFDASVGAVPPEPQTAGAVLYDPGNPLDRQHAQAAVALFPGLKALALPCGGHPASGVLRASGRAGVIQKAAMGRVPLGQIRTAHRAVRRGAAPYWANLAQRATRHHPDCAAKLAKNPRAKG